MAVVQDALHVLGVMVVRGSLIKNMYMVVQVYKLEVLTQMLIIAVQEVAIVLNMIQM